MGGTFCLPRHQPNACLECIYIATLVMKLMSSLAGTEPIAAAVGNEGTQQRTTWMENPVQRRRSVVFPARRGPVKTSAEKLSAASRTVGWIARRITACDTSKLTV